MLRFLPLLVLAFPIFAAEPGKDRHGDPLPEGAIARLGTERFRNIEIYSGMHLLPDGKTLCAMVRSKNTLIDITTGLPTGTVPAPKGGYALTASAISDDASVAATTKYDGIEVWNFKTGAKLLEIKGALHSNEHSISFSADGKYLAVGGRVDEKQKEKGVLATVWDIAAKKEIASVKVAQNTQCFVALSADGKTLATWGYHNEPNQAYDKYDAQKDPNLLVQFWSVAEAKEQASGRLNTSQVAVAISPDGKTVAGSSGNGEIKLWNSKTGERLKTLIGRSRIGKTLRFSPDGVTLAASADDAAIQLFDTATGRSKSITAAPITGEYMTVRGLRFTGPDKAIALVPHGISAVVWEIPSGKRLSTEGGHHEGIAAISFSQDGKEILSATLVGALLRWNSKGEELGSLALKIPGSNVPMPRAPNLVIYPGGKILTCDTGNEIGMFELPSGVQKCVLPCEGAFSNRILMNAAQTKAVVLQPPPYSTAKDKPKLYRILSFDLEAGQKGESLTLPPGEYVVYALSPDGATLMTVRRVVTEKGESDLILTSIDTATGKVNAETPLKLGFGVPAIAFAKDGKTFVFLRGDRGVSVMDTNTLQKEREIKIDKSDLIPTLPVFSPDGTRLAIASGSGYGSNSTTIEVFDYASGKRTHSFTGHSQNVLCLAFSPDGQTLASGSSDTTGLLWDLKKAAKE